jgi:hypothetical protein
LATENTEAGGTRNPKGHGNLLCNMGIISWNKNKKLKDCSTEITEFFIFLAAKVREDTRRREETKKKLFLPSATRGANFVE